MPKDLTLEQAIRQIESLEMTGLVRAAASGVSRAMLLLQKRVRVTIGQYINEPGLAGMPIAPLADFTIAQRIAAGYTPDEPGLREYGLDGMRFSYRMKTEVTPLHKVIGTVSTTAIRAVVFELGRMSSHGYQPPRPVLAAALVHETPRMIQTLANELYRVESGSPPRAVVKDDTPSGGDE